MYRVYLAARYSRRDEMRGYAEQLKQLGYTVDADWIFGDNTTEVAKIVEAAEWSVPIVAREFAEVDYDDVWDSDAVVSFTETPYSVTNRGGRHVEFGLALAWDKALFVVGPCENIFHTLEHVRHFDEWGEAVLDALDRERRG